MGQSRELKLPSWRRFWRVFLAWTASVYLLSVLSFAPSQGMRVLRDPGFHLTFLIPAVCVGGIGGLVFAGSSSAPGMRRAIVGASAGFASALLGAAVGGVALTTPSSEGEAWFGILALPSVFFATLTGLAIGFWSREEP